MKNKFGIILNLLVIIIFLTACAGNATPTTFSNPTTVPQQLALARTKIKHIVIIMQENPSFDHYFGTYPGAALGRNPDQQLSVPISGCGDKPLRTNSSELPYLPDAHVGVANYI